MVHIRKLALFVTLSHACLACDISLFHVFFPEDLEEGSNVELKGQHEIEDDAKAMTYSRSLMKLGEGPRTVTDILGKISNGRVRKAIQKQFLPHPRSHGIGNGLRKKNPKEKKRRVKKVSKELKKQKQNRGYLKSMEAGQTSGWCRWLISTSRTN